MRVNWFDVRDIKVEPYSEVDTITQIEPLGEVPIHGDRDWELDSDAEEVISNWFFGNIRIRVIDCFHDAIVCEVLLGYWNRPDHTFWQC